MNYTLNNLPRDMLYEIFSYLEFEDLLTSYAPNKHWTESLRLEIKRRIAKDALNEDKYSLNELRILGKKYSFIIKAIVSEIYRRLNHNYLKELLEKLPNKKWDTLHISCNPNINLQDVFANPDKSWNYDSLSRNPNVTLQDVLDHPEISWNYDELSKNPNITVQDIHNHPEIPWVYASMSWHPNITLQDILRDILKDPLKKWSPVGLSWNPNVTLQHTLSYPQIPWDYYELSSNPHITIQDVINYPEKKWDYKWLSWNPNITLEDILKHSYNFWDHSGLSRNPNITMNDIISHPEISWDYDWLSKNSNISMRDVMKYPKKPWDYYELSLNPNITPQDVISHPELSWDYTWLSRNQFSKDPEYIQIAHKIITELSLNTLNTSNNLDKVPININGELTELTPEHIYGLVVGLHSNNKLEQYSITFWDFSINIKNVKSFFGKSIRETKYLIYVNDRPHHFASLDFLMGLKSSKNISEDRLLKCYDKSNKYAEISVI